MKNRLKTVALLLLVSISLLTLSSCYMVDINELAGMGSGSTDTSDFVTKDELDSLLSSSDKEYSINSGDNYNITIDGGASSNLVAASKGLLSAVSINCLFNVTVNPYYGNSYTTQKSSAGAGVIYRLDKEKGDAYIITNYHVVYYNGADTPNDISDEISVYLYGMEYSEYAIKATYVGGSKNYDIAVLKVSGSSTLRKSNASAAVFADSNKTSVLETAIAIGNPKASGISATVGAVNVDSETLTMTSIDGLGKVSLRVMRIDAAVNGGNSGGGLFNDKGEVIGIVNAKMSDSTIDNIGYAIPSNVAKYVAENIIYYDGLDPTNDSVYRILIGVNVAIHSAGTVYDLETGKVLKVEEVMVENVVSDGASVGKLQSGDIIKSVEIDGVTYEIVRTFNVIDVMLTARQNSTVIFNISRGGKDIAVEIDVSGVTPVEY
jgi:serine protease Do